MESLVLQKINHEYKRHKLETMQQATARLQLCFLQRLYLSVYFLFTLTKSDITPLVCYDKSQVQQ